LQGLAPGVVVTQNLGSPGNDASTIRIRGQGSISSDNSPLVLVDGIQVPNINLVNPEDIESISILKDAASASIYGARAANGVILITTKRGETGKFTVNADFSYGAQLPTMVPKFVGLEKNFLFKDVYRLNNGEPMEYGANYIKNYLDNIRLNGPTDQYQDNDWYKAVVASSSPLHRQNFSVSGGGDKVSARLSIVNQEQKGLMPNTNFNRKSIRSNIDLRPLNWMRFTTDIFIQNSEKIDPPTGVGRIFEMINGLEPNREFLVGNNLWGWAWRGENPLAFAKDGGKITDNNEHTLLNLTAHLTPFKGINIEFGYSNLRDNDKIIQFTERFAYYTAGTNPGDSPDFSGYNPSVNSMSIISRNRTQNYYKAIVSYEKSVKDHYFKILTGADAVDFSYSDHSGSRTNFPLGIAYPQLSLGDREGMNNSSSANEWAIASVLGRFNYSFKDRYLFEASARYDGSSRFASENRWGLFPALSAGWRISEESFMKNNAWVSNLKLRASWGQLGNQNIGSNYPYQSLVDLNQPSILNETSKLGAAVTQWAYRGITWEESEQTNIGLDFGFFNNKLSGSLDFYSKYTSNILLILALPNSSGLAANFQNGAEMENKGWEIVLNWEDKIGGLTYYVTGQLDDNRNKVTNLLGTGPYISNDRIREEGVEFDALYGWESIGILSKSDLTDNTVPKQNSSGLIEGNLKFKDQNGDGVIDVNDRVVIGSEIPRYNYSFISGASYKGVMLDIILQGVGKRDGYVRRLGKGQESFGNNTYDWEWDSYIPADHPIFTVHKYDELFGLKPNINSSLPAPGGDNGPFNDFWIKSRAYLRIKNVTLSYDLPKSVTGKLNIQNIRIYVSGENLYTFHNFIRGFDPEFSSGRGYWQYPNISKVTGGINLTF
jgi:TonB-linked SusC/RagA family outer membrane protein